MQMLPMFTVLQAIFSMSSDNLPISRATLLRRLPISAADLERQLAALGRAGFIDLARLRLTLPGLATAVAMRATRSPAARVTRAAA